MTDDCSKILDELRLYINKEDVSGFEFNIAKLIIQLENTNYKTIDKFLKMAEDICDLINDISETSDKYLNYCIEASKKGNSFADYILAQVYWNSEDDFDNNDIKGYKHAILAANKNNMFALYALYRAHISGHRGAKKDSEKAYEYCKLASEQNYIPAIHNITTEYVLKYIGNDKWALESEYWKKNIEKYMGMVVSEENQLYNVLKYTIGEIRRLETQIEHLQYMPNGPGYENAKNEFYTASQQTKQIDSLIAHHRIKNQMDAPLCER